MTTTIQSGDISLTTSVKIGDTVTIGETQVKGRVTMMSFSRRSLRACVQYVDGQGRVQEDWQDTEDLIPVS